MYENRCKWCNKMIVVEKQQSFAGHVATCLKNPKSKKISDEVIRQVIEYYNLGYSSSQTAKKFNIGKTTVLS